VSDTHTARPPGGGVNDTVTNTGDLIRLVVADGEVVAGVVIRCPNPWVYRTPYLVPEDVD
jgi:hypothetical protein